MDEARRIRLNRMRWHCRRALLELDLVFQRFWERRGLDISEAQEQALVKLLALEDHDLWALVSGKEQSDDPALVGMIAELRSAH
jgi:succinate dehydrogenase flavin-adding protein (antitoxin of CptAB toxin-antitoxin module)